MTTEVSDTPRTDAHYSNRVLSGHGKDIVHAEDLERDFNTMRRTLEQCVFMMKQAWPLIEGKIAGDVMYESQIKGTEELLKKHEKQA